MKTTIELSDELLKTAKAHAVRQNVTLRALIERGLHLVLRADGETAPFQLRDASVGGRGLQPEFRDANWTRIGEVIYKGRGG